MAVGSKVRLREKRLEDLEDDYAWRRDPELASYDAAPPLRMSLGEYGAYYRDELEHPHPRRRRFAIEDAEGRHIGNCMYYDINEAQGQAELGIMIGDRSYWGRGYGTEAMLALVGHIFETTSLRRLYLNTLDWNVRAQRSFAKCGFREVGRRQREGKVFVTMELSRERWLAAKEQREKVTSDS